MFNRTTNQGAEAIPSNDRCERSPLSKSTEHRPGLNRTIIVRDTRLSTQPACQVMLFVSPSIGYMVASPRRRAWPLFDDVAQQKSGCPAPEECNPFSLSRRPRRGGHIYTTNRWPRTVTKGLHAMSRQARAFDIPAHKLAQPHWERCQVLWLWKPSSPNGILSCAFLCYSECLIFVRFFRSRCKPDYCRSPWLTKTGVPCMLHNM